MLKHIVYNRYVDMRLMSFRVYLPIQKSWIMEILLYILKQVHLRLSRVLSIIHILCSPLLSLSRVPLGRTAKQELGYSGTTVNLLDYTLRITATSAIIIDAPTPTPALSESSLVSHLRMPILFTETIR